MAKATKLPSGSWRVKQYMYTDENGKKHYESFTAPSKKEAEFLASEAKLNLKIKSSASTVKFGDAMDMMYEDKLTSLSPSTARLMKGQIDGPYFDSIKGKRVSELTDRDVQRMVNLWTTDDLSPKTIRNLYGLFTSTVKSVDKSMTFDVRLPEPERTEIYIPTSEEVTMLIEASRDTPLELPLLLAAHMGLRRSEIVALQWSNVDMKNRKLTINQATVLGLDNKKVVKKPKTTAGNRRIDIPLTVMDALERHRDDDKTMVVPLSGDAIYNRYKKLLVQLKLPSFRFHDLRHYYASVLLSLGVPDKYAMERMGHATNSVLKTVYQHTMDEKQREITDSLDAFFSPEKQKAPDE